MFVGSYFDDIGRSIDYIQIDKNGQFRSTNYQAVIFYFSNNMIHCYTRYFSVYYPGEFTEFTSEYSYQQINSINMKTVEKVTKKMGKTGRIACHYYLLSSIKLYQRKGEEMSIFDVVRFNGLDGKNWVIYKFPREGIVWGSRLIVQEGQVAIFVKDGKVCDLKTPGSYKLESDNLPILATLVNIPFGFRTPFSAEVYFINVTSTLNLYWGTNDPIQVVDPKYSVRLHIRAFGQLGLKMLDPLMFFKDVIGGMDSNEIVKYDKVLEYYKGSVVMTVKARISETIIEKKISALEISTQLDDLSVRLKNEFSERFKESGFRLLNFVVSSINFPDEDFDKINRILENKAEFDLMGDDKYRKKRSFDVLENAADNKGGVAGAMFSGGLGMGAGMGAFREMENLENFFSTSSFSTSSSNETASNGKTVNKTKCPHCNELIELGTKFCPHCGKSVEVKTSKCPKCGSEIKEGMKFCPTCGTKLGKKTCSCGTELEPGSKFCPNCGKPVEK